MYLVITKHTRPSTDVGFYNFKQSTEIAQETKDHFVSTYVLSGKIIHTAWTEEDDGLSTTSQSFWLSKAEFDSYLNDPILIADYFPARAEYNTINGIVMEQISAEEI